MSFMPASTVKRLVDLYKSEAKKAGWTPGPEQILYRGLAGISDTNEPHESPYDKAEAQARATHTPAPIMIMGTYFTGGPRNVLRQIEPLRDAGVGIIDMNLSSSIDRVDYDGQLVATELFAKKILPEIRSW